MSELRSKSFRGDRKYPTFIRLYILVYPISFVVTDFWRFKVQNFKNSVLCRLKVVVYMLNLKKSADLRTCPYYDSKAASVNLVMGKLLKLRLIARKRMRHKI